VGGIAAPDLTLFKLSVVPVAPVAVDPLAGVGDRLAGLAFGFLLYKLLRYRDAHQDAHNGAHIESELAEFDP